MSEKSEEPEWKCYCEGLRLAGAGAEEMKLPLYSNGFSLLGKKLGMLNLTLGGRIPARSTEGDNEPDPSLKLTSFKGTRSDARQTPNLLKYI